MMKRIKESLSRFWTSLGPARLPLLIVSVFLLVALMALAGLLAMRNHKPETVLTAAIIVPVEKESAAAPEPEETNVASGTPLSAAPNAGLLEDNDIGPLPRRGSDGRTPWQVYGKPFDVSDTRPMVAIILTDMGLSAGATENAITTLPATITFAFSPYANRLSNAVDKARNAGFETLLTLPTEPTTYPDIDPGPETLLTSLSAEENMQRLHWVLSRVSGAVGVMTGNNSKFMATENMVAPVLSDINQRGLLLVDTTAQNASSAGPLIASELKMPFAEASLILDKNGSQELGRDGINKNLEKLVAQAKQNGSAIAVASPSPMMLAQLREWTAQLPLQNIVLAPVSAVVAKRLQPQNKTSISAPAITPNGIVPASPQARAVAPLAAQEPAATEAQTVIVPGKATNSTPSASPAVKAQKPVQQNSIAPRKKQQRRRAAPQQRPTSITPYYYD